MTDIADMSNDNSGNIEIDFDFNDGLIDLEDISDKKSLPFEEIDEGETIDFSDEAQNQDEITSVELTQEIEDDEIIDLVHLAPDSSESITDKEEIIDLVNIVKESVDSVTEDDEIIELVNILEEHAHSTQHDSIDSDQSESMKEAHIKEMVEKLQQEEVVVQQLPSEEQIEVMLEKAIEKRYAEKLDSMLSEVVENILNRQMDNIRKKILTALRDVDIS